MPGPKEEELRKLQPMQEPIDEKPSRIITETVSSKRMEDPGEQPKLPSGTRARRPRGRSGSESNRSTKTRGH